MEMQEKVTFEWVKEQFFSDEGKVLRLKKGDVLLEHNQKNTRLFLVKKGKLLGYLTDAELETYPIFEATDDKFIGVYSYFSDENLSYSKVVAEEDSVIYYYDKALTDHSDEELVRLTPFLISVVVNELYSRQHFAKQMAREKHNDVQKLLKAEKMATLGQMAAGLAHELNNSIGVLGGSLDHIRAFIARGAARHGDINLLEFFNMGYENGQLLSSEEARAARKKYEAIKGLDDSQTRKLSKTGIEPEKIEALLKKGPGLTDEVYKCWEVGCTLHDMEIAAKHSAHVVRSVKQLGVTEHSWARNVDVNDTINEALVIVQNLSKRVNTTLQLDQNLPVTEACAGQLIQVWINIIKNGIESMLQANTPQPELLITSEHSQKYIEVGVVDNGPGIPENIISKIFQPSFTTKVGGLSFGLGLGLSIVQRIVTEHDGLINVRSVPGKTEFLIKIPIINGK